MKREEYISDIKLALGHPVVKIENEAQIGPLVDKAFRELRRFIVDTRYVTVPFSNGVIDIKEYNINSIVQLFRNKANNRLSEFSDVFYLSSVSLGTSTSQINLDTYNRRVMLGQLQNTMSTDLDWTMDDECTTLYVNANYPRPESITIVYIPNFEDVSDVKDDYWVSYILRFALALEKESLGRIRNKYNLSSSLYKLDGDQLISEGIAEQAQIRQELSENSDVVFPID